MTRQRIGIFLFMGIGILAMLFSTLLGNVAPAHADASTAPFYGFEDGTDGFTAPAWLSNNAGQPSQSSTQYTEGTHSLALPVNFINGGWDQAGVDEVINNYNPIDLTAYSAISYDIYAPVANIWSEPVFNDPWLPPVNPKPLQVGWNTITFDISPSSQDFPNAGAYFSTAKEFLLLAIGRNATYNGPVYFDNVHFVPATGPVVRVVAPQIDDTLSVPQGQSYTIQASVTAPQGHSITSVTFNTPKQSGQLTFDSTSGLYTGSWNIWREGEGLKTLAITATDSSGATVTIQRSVLIQDSQLKVHITNPTFDQILTGKVTVSAQVQSDPRFTLRSVTLKVGSLSLPMRASASTPSIYTAQLDSSKIPNNVYTVSVVAHDTQFAVSDLADVQIANHLQPEHIVRTRGTVFTDGSRSFRYVGWNEYDLFTRNDETLNHDEQTSEGNVLLKGTVIPWQQQIDRQMLEAERAGLTVARTWAFDNIASDPSAFETAPGQFNESTFAKLDYIVASAQRHHMRVILPMENYWNDYGGIQAVATWLGLPNKLLFFTDPQAQQVYKDFVAHLVNRVNTVNGVAYKNDPTIFAWELMNEPNISCGDDPTPNHQYCDPTGQVLRTWIATMSQYIKSLDPLHMVTAGAEAHGQIPAGDGVQSFQWGGSIDPLFTQSVPNVDFFTFHPYPNTSWINLTLQQTKQLIRSITKEGTQLGKPVVMEEYGIDRNVALYNPAGTTLLQPADPAFATTRVTWYRDMLDALYDAGGAGSNVWQLADWSDNDYNVNSYLPLIGVERDEGIMNVFSTTAKQIGQGDNNSWWW